MNLSVLLPATARLAGRGGSDRAKRRRSAGCHMDHDYAPAIRGLVLASPAFKVNCMCRWHVLRWRYGIVCVVCFY